MKQTQIIMGMPITIEVVDAQVAKSIFQKVFSYFRSIDRQFSTYKATSELSRINHGKISLHQASFAMRQMFRLAEKTKSQTLGFFDITHNGTYDLSGIVKGYAIEQAAKLLRKSGYRNYYINAGGDISVAGKNSKGRPWSIGIRNPFDNKTLVKSIGVSGMGVATSGTYERGGHIYNPYAHYAKPSDVVSLTVIAPTVFDADRFATAAFAMGQKGIAFIDTLPEMEGYMITRDKKAVMTPGFLQYCLED